MSSRECPANGSCTPLRPKLRRKQVHSGTRLLNDALAQRRLPSKRPRLASRIQSPPAARAYTPATATATKRPTSASAARSRSRPTRSKTRAPRIRAMNVIIGTGRLSPGWRVGNPLCSSGAYRYKPRSWKMRSSAPRRVKFLGNLPKRETGRGQLLSPLPETKEVLRKPQP
jgi:hypothetical protein